MNLHVVLGFFTFVVVLVVAVFILLAGELRLGDRVQRRIGPPDERGGYS